MASSPVSMTELAITTSVQPSGSMPSAHTPSFRLVWIRMPSMVSRVHA